MARKRKPGSRKKEREESPALMKARGPLLAVTFLLAALLLFARLGHYSLWDDESMIGLIAKGVLRTGDTSAWVGHNLVAYRNGILLKDFHDRSTPPLSTYLAAASFALLGPDALAARLPFAICGLAAIGLLLWWLWKSGASFAAQLLYCMGILGNVSLFLYCRQSRYYSPAVLCTIAIAWIYLRYEGSKKMLVVLSLACVGLLAANPLNCLALYACLAVDYLLYRRKERPLLPSEWVLVIAPQALLGGILLAIWNPFHTQFGGYVMQNTLADRVALFFWNWRDLDLCEFLVGALVLAAPVLGFFRPDRMLIRGSLALFVYVSAVTAVSPQTVHGASLADVRYLVPLIPLCIFLSARVLVLLVAKRNLALAAFAGAIAFFTNLLCGGPLLTAGFRSTLWSYLGELANPPGDPYAVAADWINRNVAEGESIWVEPDYMAYPLMFHAPKAIYAWQLTPPVNPEFASVDPILMQGRVPPDYIFAFGPVVIQIRALMENFASKGIRYEPAATLDFFYRDVYRPELFLRTFEPITVYDKNLQAIYIFKRVGK